MGKEGACRAHPVRCTRSPRDAKPERIYVIGELRGEFVGGTGFVSETAARDDGQIPIQPRGVLPQSANGVKTGWRTACAG